MSSFLTGQKGSEKAAANSEARGTAKGACGPLWKPRSFKGVAREGLCLQPGQVRNIYAKLSLHPARLIRAPVLKPRPRSRAGRSAANIFFTHLPVVPGRFVGAACMRLVGVCPTMPFLGHDGVWSMRRGGIHAARQGCPLRGVPEKTDRFRRFVGRAISPAEPYYFLKIIGAAGSAPAGAFRRPTAAQRRLLGRRSRPRPTNQDAPSLSGCGWS